DHRPCRARRAAAARRGPRPDVRLRHPARAVRPAGEGLRGRAGGHPAGGPRPGPRLRDGGRHQLQQRVGLARLPGRRRVRPAEGRGHGGLPHRRFGGVGHRLGRRRGRHVGVRRGRGRDVLRGVGRERRGPPDGLRLHRLDDVPGLGVRDQLRLLRPVRAGEGPAVPPEAGGAVLGGVGQLPAHRSHRLPPADRVEPERGRARRPGPDLGWRRRSRLDGHPDRAAPRRHPDRRGVRRRPRQAVHGPRRQGLHQPHRVRPLGTAAGHPRHRGDGPVDAGRPRLRPEVLGGARRAQVPAGRAGAHRAGHHPDLDVPVRHGRHGGHLRRHQRLQRRRRPALHVDAAEAAAGVALREPAAVPPGDPARVRRRPGPVPVLDRRLQRRRHGAPDAVREQAPVREHGGAGQRGRGAV
ncbi:MAG: Crotonyl-CoA carboxylase/reductase, ethylmalonyl-CoA producing, partial [uncultured Corynebacteriales bacterium]